MAAPDGRLMHPLPAELGEGRWCSFLGFDLNDRGQGVFAATFLDGDGELGSGVFRLHPNGRTRLLAYSALSSSSALSA